VKPSVSGETDNTAEFELSADELDSLRANQPSVSQGSARLLNPARLLERARALHLRSLGIALAFSVLLAAFLLAIGGQRISKPTAQPLCQKIALASATAAAPKVPSTPSIKPTPVRLANPFDATEVFEFPPGTSLARARETMVERLLDRARGRHVRHGRRSRNHRELRNS